MAEEVELSDEEESKGGALKWIIIGVVSVLIIAGGVVGTLFALGMFDSDSVEASADGSEGEEEEKKEAVYVSVDPPFTVNFKGKSRARFLQVGVGVMTRDPEMEENLKLHMPVIRNNLLMLFGTKTSAELETLSGKQKLQKEALTVVQRILEEETGNKGAEAVYFTSFVMQ